MEKIYDSDLICKLMNSMKLLFRLINDIKEEDYKKYIDKDTEEFIEAIIDLNMDLTINLSYLRNKNKVKDKDLLKLNDLVYSLYNNLDNVKIKVIKKESKENGRK